MFFYHKNLGMTTGIIILVVGCFFLEQSTVLKKKLGKEIDIHQISFLTMLTTTIFAGIVLFLQNDRTFTRTLLSFFLLIFQILAGVIFTEITNKAIHHADRSTFSVMSTIAIPLLLVSDIFLGYEVSLRQIIGVVILVAMLSYTIFKGDFSMKGMKYVVISNLISIGTIMAFKYSTVHFASTELMNFYNAGCMSILFFIIVCRTKGLRGVKNVFKRKYFWFASLYGVGSILSAAAYKYMIASMVVALKRFLSMMFGVITGKLYFHETNTSKKLTIASLVGMAVLMMNIWPVLSAYRGLDETETPETFHASAPTKPEKSDLNFPLPNKIHLPKERKKSTDPFLFSPFRLPF